MSYDESALKTIQENLTKVSKDLSEHVREDKRIHEKSQVYLPEYQEASTMGMDNISDKVNINVGEGRGGDSGATAAIIAALGNRNQGDSSAALIAALGSRNNDNQLAPLLAMMNNRDGDRDGLGEMWPLLLLLMGRGGRGGLFGGGDDCGNGGGDAVNQLTLNQVLGKLGTLEGQIPLTASQAQNAIQSAIAQLALADQQGFANTKDAVQNTLLALSQALATVNQNVSAQGCQTREYVGNDGDKTRALLVNRFSQEDMAKIGEQNARIVALETSREHDRRHSEATLQITNTNTAVAAQAQYQQQQQQQFQIDSSLERAVGRIVGSFNQTMLARQGQDIVNLGTMTASGTQAAANTQVR